MKTDSEVHRMIRERSKGKTLDQAAARAGMSVPTARKYLRTGKLPSQLKQPAPIAPVLTLSSAIGPGSRLTLNATVPFRLRPSSLCCASSTPAAIKLANFARSSAASLPGVPFMVLIKRSSSSKSISLVAWRSPTLRT